MAQAAAVLIPARYSSTRFPGKPLAPILGRPMIQRVYENAVRSGLPCYVVTDDGRIQHAVEGFGGRCLRVDDDVPSGSERIALAAARHLPGFELYINVQGDEPLLKGEMLAELAAFHRASGFDIATVVRPRSRAEAAWGDPNVVKTVMGKGGRCLYFSRSPVPHDRDGQEPGWHQHVGVYSYRAQALARFVALPEGRLENLEKLEQLRALEDGMSIGALETRQELIGVDVPADVKKVEEALHGER